MSAQTHQLHPYVASHAPHAQQHRDGPGMVQVPGQMGEDEPSPHHKGKHAQCKSACRHGCKQGAWCLRNLNLMKPRA